MPLRLVDALTEILADWTGDLPPAWKATLSDIELGLKHCDPLLELEPWEPVFPTLRQKRFPGAPEGAHMFRAFDGVEPGDVRCVILGQDPYPEPGFATGRAFEAGNVAGWREFDKMFSKSMRALMQLVCTARTGDESYSRSFADWPALLYDIESGVFELEAPDRIADRWEAQGVLLLNSALTLSRFKVEGDPHQNRGHLPVWRPLIVGVLQALVDRGKPLVILAFGDVAADNLVAAGVAESTPDTQVILRPHPADAEGVLADENPFLACNRFLDKSSSKKIAW